MRPSNERKFSQLIFRCPQEEFDCIDTLYILQPTGKVITLDHCNECRDAMGKESYWSCSPSRSGDCWIDEGDSTIYHQAYLLERR